MTVMKGDGMKRAMFIVVLALLAGPGTPAGAQPRVRGDGQDRPDRRERIQRQDRIDRVERLRQMRLIEELDLGEEEAVRIMAKRKEHEDRMKGLTEERNSVLDGLRRKLDADPAAKPSDQAIESDVARVIEQDRMLFEERKRYQGEVRRMLTPEKFARMLIFERDFQMQVRDAMGRSVNRGRGKFDE